MRISFLRVNWFIEGVLFSYEAVCSPFRIRRSTRQVRFIILNCWLGSFIVAIPQLFIFEESVFPDTLNKTHCASTGYTAEWQRRVYFTAFACYLLFIPAMCLSIWYIRIIRAITRSTKSWTILISSQRQNFVPTGQQIRTVKLAMTIITVFLICWTPYMVITLVEIYSEGRFRIPSQLDGVLRIICLHQSGLNPLIYLIFDQRRRYSATLIFVAGSSDSHRKVRSQQRERDGSIVTIQFEHERPEKSL